MHLLGCPKERNNLLRYGNGITRSGVATGARITLLHRERAEATKLHPVPSSESITDGAEDCIHYGLDIALMQMPVLIGERSYQLRFDHELLTCRQRNVEPIPF
jgi:hypothetical protein